MKKRNFKFTDADVRNFKTTKRLEDRLEGDGFGVRVYGTGTKVFYFIYTFDGKRRFFNLGEYPAVSLAEARKRHVEAKVKIASGVDPLLEKDQKKAERKRMPFVSDLIESYIEEYAKEHNKGWKEIERALKAEIFPRWGKRKSGDIKRCDLISVTDEIKKRGAPIMSNRLLAYTRKMFSWAVDEGLLEVNPFLRMKKRSVEISRERVLSESEIKTLWHNLDQAKMSDSIKRALKLILVTGQRPGEVIGMHRSEIDGDWWQIPAVRSKNKQPHRVFLTKTAKELIGEEPGFIFKSPVPAKDEKGNVKDKAYEVRTMTHDIKANLPHNHESKVQDKLQIPHFTPHDLRRTAATRWAEMETPGYMIDRLQNHITKQKQGVGHVYNRYSYAREKQLALEKWERKLLSIVGTTKKGTVISLARKTA